MPAWRRSKARSHFGDVVQAITEKLIRRHPHVFGDTRHLTPDEVKGLWDRIKAEEKAERAARGAVRIDEAGRPRRRSGRPSRAHARAEAAAESLQGRLRLERSEGRAAKIREEADEIEAAIDAATRTRRPAKSATCMFALVNLARHLDVDPDAALRGTNLEIRAPVRRDRGRIVTRWQNPVRGDACRDGRALGSGQGGGGKA